MKTSFTVDLNESEVNEVIVKHVANRRPCRILAFHGPNALEGKSLGDTWTGIASVVEIDKAAILGLVQEFAKTQLTDPQRIGSSEVQIHIEPGGEKIIGASVKFHCNGAPPRK